MTEIAGASISSKIADIYPQPIAPLRVLMNFGRIDRLIGKSIPRQIILDILSGLGFGLDEVNDTGFVAVVPTVKTEVTREADVIEEILRIYGLNNVEVPSSLRASISYKEKVTRDEMEDSIAQLLIPNGFQEIMTNTISQSSFYEKESEEVKSALVKLLNSQTAELDIMRAEIYFSGLESIAYNLNRKNQFIRFFETGKVYRKAEGKYLQEDRTVLYMCGPSHEPSWYEAGKKSDFYQIKAFVEMMLNDNLLTHTKIEYVQQAPFEYGLSYWRGRELLVKFGKLKKSICKQFDIKEEVYYAEFNFDQLWKARAQRKIQYSPVAKFPTVRRDLALVLAESVQFEQLQQIAVRELKHHLKELSLFDVYKGDKVAEGQKSYAMSFLLGDDQKTLTDQEIDQFMNKLLVAYSTDLNASLRQ
jgi:phenylalanyl-tRNA synthetase beta chain